MNYRKIVFVAAAALGLSLFSGGLAGAQVSLDPALPDYKPVQGISGSIKSIGSDTMNNEMTLWAEGFLKMYPNVQIEIEGKGSSTAPPALIAGTSQFGPMSRERKARRSMSSRKNTATSRSGCPPPSTCWRST